jgi:hypothetical protein
MQALGDRPVAYRPALARVLGGVREALFVSQLLYWDGKGATAGGWIYKTQAEWRAETGLSRYEQETVRRHLRDRGVLQEDLRGLPARLYYRLDFGVLAKLVGGVERSAGSPSQDAAPAQTGLRRERDLACGEDAGIGCGAAAGQPGTPPHAISESTAQNSNADRAQAGRSADGSEVDGARRERALEKAWHSARAELRMSMVRGAFERWIAPCALVALDRAAGQATIEVPDAYARDWLAGRMDALVARTLSGVVGAPLQIAYRVRGERPARPPRGA